MKKILLHSILFSISGTLFSQQNDLIKLSADKINHRVIIKVNDKPFTEFIYPDTLEKPVLYPIVAADGETITRGFPLSPRPNEPTDHPHHIGLWLNYENVNGLDFWNNSFAIPADKKNKYGWIKTDSITKIKSGKKGLLSYTAHWQDIDKNILTEEKTDFVFSAYNNIRIIDRITTLTAKQEILFADAKDGFLGLRVAHELELPSKDEREFTDAHGNITKIKATSNDVTGNYITSEGKHGDSAWSSRATWCMLYGKKGNDTISIAIIDHPENVGYPTYWHARGYGLFAANPLGQNIFSNGKQMLNFNLKKDQPVTFRYRIIVASGKERLSNTVLEKFSNEFAAMYQK